MASNTYIRSLKKIPWQQALGFCILIAGSIALVWYMVVGSHDGPTQAYLSAETKQAYTDALALAAVAESSNAAIERLDVEIARVRSAPQNKNTPYTEAKIDIYKADIYITYGFDYQRGFNLLGEVYSNTHHDNLVRAEALLLAMAHGFQALDEGALSVEQVRNHLFLNASFKEPLGIGLADALLINEPLEAYPYFARGFATAAALTTSPRVNTLAESYYMRLSSPFVVPPPTGGYYQDFVLSLKNSEAQLDVVVDDYADQKTSYQEFIPASYYNMARTYETLPQGDVRVADNMMRLHKKLATYIQIHPESSYGARAYLIGIDTRIICKAVDEADFNVAYIDTGKMQPYLDELYASEGWVIPCKEAFEVVAKDIDPRFAKYF